MLGWRDMMAEDLDAVEAIAALVHPRYPESADVPRERLALFPAGCLLAEADSRPAGYVIAHPWRLGTAPALDSLLGSLPAAPDCLYLHALALLPSARGDRAGAAAVARLRAVAAVHGLARIALVAVNESAGFWRRLGFRATTPGPDLMAALASYDADATYLIG